MSVICISFSSGLLIFIEVDFLKFGYFFKLILILYNRFLTDIQRIFVFFVNVYESFLHASTPLVRLRKKRGASRKFDEVEDGRGYGNTQYALRRRTNS